MDLFSRRPYGSCHGSIVVSIEINCLREAQKPLCISVNMNAPDIIAAIYHISRIGDFVFNQKIAPNKF